MNKILKSTILIIVLGLLSCYTVSADSGETLNYFYDFEEYTAKIGDGVGPDSRWGYYHYSNRKEFGGYYDDEQGQCMKIMINAEPSFIFPEMITSGYVHVSYKIKFSGDKTKVLSLFYDNSNNDEGKITNTNYSKWTYMNYEPGKMFYYDTGGTDSMIAWSRKQSSVTFDAGEWHRLDFISTDISKPDAQANYYLDGQLINPSPIYFADSMGFKTVTFRVESSEENPNETHYVLIDDVSIKRVYSEIDTSLNANIIGHDRVALNNAEFSVSLSEDVDVSLLTKRNITITNLSTGTQIENFEVKNATSRTFDVKVDGELESGKYELMLNNTIVGGVFKKSMKNPLIFRTEYKYYYYEDVYLDDNFNTYSAVDGTLPEGYTLISDNVSSTNALSSEGKSGNDEDKSLGFEIAGRNRSMVRFMRPVSKQISSGARYRLKFDVKFDGAAWAVYIAQEGDIDQTSINYDNNVLMSCDEEGNIKYAKVREEKASETIDSNLVLTAGEWHSVCVEFVPNSDGNENYIISIDGGEKYTLPVNRNYYNKVTEGVGIGYQAMVKDAKLYFDNIKMEYSGEAPYPEVEDIILYDVTGKKVTGEIVTSLVQKAEIVFNTVVKTENISKFIDVTENGSEMSYKCSPDTDGEKTVIVLTFPNLLKPETKYLINVMSGIESSIVDGLTSETIGNKKFEAEDDAAIVMFNEDFNDDNTEYKTFFAKNTDEEVKYTIAVVGYNNKQCVVDGKEETFRQMVGMKYVAVELNANDKGVFEYTVPTDLGECEEKDVFIWTYPDLKKTSYRKDIKIN